MKRRQFLSLSAAVAARLAFGTESGALTKVPQVPQGLQVPLGLQKAQVSVDTVDLGQVPADYTGLSYESAQLYNPAYFSDTNAGLIKALRNLSPRGVLRLGGNLSDVTRWNGPGGDFSTPRQVAGVEYGKSYWEWKLTDPSVRANQDGAITPAAITNLGRFLRATDWKLIYGLNFGCGSPARAAEEARFVSQQVGKDLLAFQVGNEDDFFGGRPLFRQKPYDFDQYMREYTVFVDAVRAAVPQARFAGPDTATNMDWVTRFGEREGASAVMLSSHFYAMGPAKDSSMDAAFLLSRNKRLERQIEEAREAVARANGPRFRMTEGNSCFGGGKPGVSDAFASSLWGADYMLACASAGYCGINLHGGGDGIYTPIAIGENLSTELRPLYFGMQFAQSFAGWNLRRCDVTTAANLTAYFGRKAGEQQMALINKGETPVHVELMGAILGNPIRQATRLSGPGLDAKQGVKLSEVAPPSGRTIALEAFTALLLRWA